MTTGLFSRIERIKTELFRMEAPDQALLFLFLFNSGDWRGRAKHFFYLKMYKFSLIKLLPVIA